MTLPETFTIDTPATVGDLQSWSVSESATQASPVEPVRGTPSFSATVKRTDKTKFAAHNGVSLTHDKLGTLDGYVRSVNPVGVYSHLDCQTVLNQLNVDAEFSETFFPEGLLSDYVKQLVGAAVTNPPTPPPDPDAGIAWVAPTDVVPSGSWTSAAFGNDVFVATGGTAVMTSPDGVSWTKQANAPIPINDVAFGNGLFVGVGQGGATVVASVDGVTWTSRATGATAIWNGITYGNGQFVVVGKISLALTSPDGITWSSHVAPDAEWRAIAYGNGLFVATGRGATNAVMSSPDGITWTRGVAPMSEWLHVAFGNGLFVAVANNSVTRVMASVDGLTWTVGSIENSPRYGITYGNGLFVAAGGGHASTSLDGITWTPRTGFFGGGIGLCFALGEFVAVGNGAPYAMYSGIFSPPFNKWTGTTDPVVTYIPWRGNIWQMLNSLLMLNGVELVYSGGQMVVRDIGSVVVELDDATVVSRTITAVDARQSVDVAYREAFAQTGTIYDAYVDGNKAYKIEVNEYRQDKIVYEVPIRQWSLELNAMRQIGTITNVPTSLNQPTEANTGTVKPVAGQFVISSSEGKALPKGMFFGYGGSMKVSLNPVDPFSFYLTWRGPSTEIPDYPGPYSIQVGERGCFSVTGDAIFAYDKTVNVWTGADPAKVTDATPLALNVPFVNSKEQAFQVGAAAGADLCSTVEELSFDIATNKLAGFGVTPGAIFRYDNANWRIVTCNIHGATASITARYHTTYADFDAEWDGKTFDDFDAAWAGYKFKDFGIEPLRTTP